MWVADETGCPAQLTLDGAAAHEAACSFTTTTCPFAGCGVELHLNQSDSHDAAFAVAHARGERAARVLSEARLAAVESSAASTRAFFEARLAAEQASAASARVLSEARLAAVEASVTSTRVDLRDERAARLAVEANAAVMASHIASLEASAASMRAELDTQRAALEARLSMVEQRMSTVGIGPVVLPMRSDGWGVRHIIGKAAADVGTARKPILCCALSPDISLVCVGLYDDDGTLMLLDVASGGLRFTLDGHEDAVNSCAFSPDGATLVSASLDNTVKLWNVASGDTVRTLQGHTSWAWCCAFSPDGRSIVSGSYDKSLKLWNAATGGCQQSLDGLAAWVRSCAYSADGMMVLSGSMDNKLKLWSVATGMCIRTFKGHTGAVSGCSFSPASGNIILSASFDKTLKLWDATTGVCRCTLTGHSGFVRGCAFSPVHGNLALSCSEDKNLHLWDTATGAGRRCMHGDAAGARQWSPLLRGQPRRHNHCQRRRFGRDQDMDVRMNAATLRDHKAFNNVQPNPSQQNATMHALNLHSLSSPRRHNNTTIAPPLPRAVSAAARIGALRHVFHKIVFSFRRRAALSSTNYTAVSAPLPIQRFCSSHAFECNTNPDDAPALTDTTLDNPAAARAATTIDDDADASVSSPVTSLNEQCTSPRVGRSNANAASSG